MLCWLLQLSHLRLDSESAIPLYKQLADAIGAAIEAGGMPAGERLPATRELAGQLGLNRTTVSAAYTLLEESGFIEGHVGRGSFVARRDAAAASRPADWEAILSRIDSEILPPAGNIEISFASSRPDRDAFPLAQFRRLAKQVIDSEDAADILQLGSPHGFPALRRYLLAQASADGIARSGDDLIITNGCQQGLDLLARSLGPGAQSIALEDPAYHGLLRAFSRAGMKLVPVPVDQAGLNVDTLEEAIQREHPKVLIVTPSFQNPTGVTLPLERRKRIVSLAQRFGLVLVENDIYSELRYRGTSLPTLKSLDETGSTILLRSYSKVSFPGLRVGWVIAPRPVISHLADAKQISDLHSDQLSQAVLLRFAESGELQHHLQRTCASGAERLDAALRACSRYLPSGATFTRPEGGMNLWIELPAPLTAEALLRRVQERGVDFLPGNYFSTRAVHMRGLRISFGGLSPEEITRGIRILGDTASEELASSSARMRFEPVPALV